ncbi:hypothetical protein [Cognataquiflexum aquatile]|nr:hypothetical protein [Cognataquiflexum aquatile]
MYARKDAGKVEVNIILGTRLKFTLHPCPTAGGGLPTSVFCPA